MALLLPLVLISIGCVSAAATQAESEKEIISTKTQSVVNQQQNCIPDINSVLRDIIAQLVELKVEMKHLQRNHEGQSTTLKELEQQDTKQQQQLQQQQQQLQQQQQQIQTHAAEMLTMETKVIITEKQVEALNKDREVRQVAFSASLLASGSGDTGPFSTQTTLIFRNVIENIGKAYDPHTGIFTAPVRGAYHFELNIHGVGPHGSGAVLMKKGQPICFAYEHQSHHRSAASNGATLLLEVGDVVFSQQWVGSRVYDDTNHRTTFSGHLLFTISAQREQILNDNGAFLHHFCTGVLLVGPEETTSLELVPSIADIVLNVNTNFTVVCSGWSPVTWMFPGDSQSDSVIVETQGSVSVLQFVNTTWMDSGRYTCEEKSSEERKYIDVFIPGEGPEEWFVPLGPHVVMKEAEEETIPCVVSDPFLNVSLFERGEQTAVVGMEFDPGRGFTGRLNDTSYVCVATRGPIEEKSQVYYVFSVIVPKQIDVELSASSTVVKKGEVLTVNCTVTNTEMVFFTWDFPRKQEVEPVTDFLPNQIRSFVNITSVISEDSGVYSCVVQETTEGPTIEKKITVRVLDQGFVYVWTSGETNMVRLLHHSVEFTVEVEAHPEPTVVWIKDNLTVPMETNSTNTKHLTGTRYSSTLSLDRVKMDQSGRYTAMASNEDMEAEVTFNLEVQAPPKITSLSELSTNTILCVSEGAPPPSVTWLICPSSLRCSNPSGGWMNLSATSVGVTQQDTVTAVETDVAKVQSVLALQAFSSVSAVRCEVNNSAGRGSRDLRMESVSLLSQVSVLVVVLVLFIIALIFLIILIVLWRKKPGYEVHYKLMESTSPDGQSYVYVDSAKLPYSSDWEIPRDQIVLGQVLGSGAFGRIVEGSVSGLMESETSTKVAVKMVKGKGDAVTSLMSELRMLLHVGPHLNLVNVLGASTTGGPVYLITEFCCHGDLLNYLQRNKNSFLLVETHSVSDGDGGYMDMENIRDLEPHADQTLEPRELPLADSDSSHLSLHDLLWFSYQVCHAMDFLSARQCVHTDLAARNVLVCEKKLVKVCDYGLARDLLKHEDYDAHGNALLPLRWMSPESIFQKVHSSHSQVWSFGVLLWEIFSLGCRPYAEQTRNRDLFNFLRQGHRMSRPEHASQNTYELMLQCWKDTPQSRPSFSSLVDSLANMLNDDYKQRYCQLTQDFHRGENPAIARSRLTQSKTEGNSVSKVTVDPLPLESVETGPAHSIQVMDVAIETISTAALDAVSVQEKEDESRL